VIPQNGGEVERRTIKTGLRNWERTEILEGVAEGEWVVRSIDREGLADGVVAEVE
jgi:HlyD family secretion protein